MSTWRKKLKLNILAKSFSDIISFRLENLIFKDSLLFLNASLEKLAENLLLKDGTTASKFPSLYQYFSQTYNINLTSELLDNVAQKQWFPYSMIETFEVLEQSLPIDQKWFVNDLTDEVISDQEYSKLLELWENFSLETVGQFYHFYLVLDVLLLTDVFTSFRQFSLQNYGIDPSKTYGLPGCRYVSN